MFTNVPPGYPTEIPSHSSVLKMEHWRRRKFSKTDCFILRILAFVKQSHASGFASLSLAGGTPVLVRRRMPWLRHRVVVLLVVRYALCQHTFRLIDLVEISCSRRATSALRGRLPGSGWAWPPLNSLQSFVMMYAFIVFIPWNQNQKPDHDVSMFRTIVLVLPRCACLTIVPVAFRIETM